MAFHARSGVAAVGDLGGAGPRQKRSWSRQHKGCPCALGTSSRRMLHSHTLCLLVNSPSCLCSSLQAAEFPGICWSSTTSQAQRGLKLHLDQVSPASVRNSLPCAQSQETPEASKMRGRHNVLLGEPRWWQCKWCGAFLSACC